MKPTNRFFQQFPNAVPAVLLGALLGHTTCGAQGVTATITPLAMPEASALTVKGLNSAGQVAGYWYNAQGDQRAFLSKDGILVDLGSLGGNCIAGAALNDLGQVVGYSQLADRSQYRAFLFSSTKMADLGSLGGATSSALAINNAGEVTGYSTLNGSSLDEHAFLFSGDTLYDLGTLGGSFSHGFAINRLGQVTGRSTKVGDLATHAFFFSAGTMTDIGTLGGGYSAGNALNNAGLVTGSASTTNDLETHAFLFSGVAPLDLGTLGGVYSEGFVINDLGQVAGDSTLAGEFDYHGFVYSDGKLRDLGTLGSNFSSAWAINNQGQIVGTSLNAATQYLAFLWQDGRMLDLNTLLPASSGWVLEAAYFLNDSNQVVGTGTYGGQPGWFLMNLPSRGNSPPVARAGQDKTVECVGENTPVRLDASASTDPNGDALTFEWRLDNVLLGTSAIIDLGIPLGTYTFTLRVTDSHGASSEDAVSVQVVDTTPPLISSVVASPALLAPLNRQMIPVTIAVVASDICDPSPVSRIVSVTSSDGPSQDWNITGPLTLELRSASASKDTARVYTILVASTDASGNTSTSTVNVKAQQHKKDDALPPARPATKMAPLTARKSASARIN